LYYFANDEENLSNCEGVCVAASPVFDGFSDLVIPYTSSAGQFGEISRADGKVQIT
jgi:predicted lipoprotein with Yx(FWY)xxD motif